MYERLGFLDDLGPEIPDIGGSRSHYGAPRRQRVQSIWFEAEPQQPARLHNPDVVPMRRWEDLTNHERRTAILVMARFGGTMRSMKRAYGAQLDQAHLAARNAGYRSPWSKDFYAGGSDVYDVLAATATRIAAHDRWPAGVNSKLVLAVAHAVTSPGVKFRSGKVGEYRYGNNEAAEAVIVHVLNGGDVDDAPSGAILKLGIYDHQIKRAVHAVQQLINDRVSAEELRQPSGLPVFSAEAPKIAAYVGAWVNPKVPTPSSLLTYTQRTE